MPSKTLADRVLDLEKLVADLSAQVRFSAEVVDGLKAREAKSAEAVNALHRDTDREIAVLKEKVVKLEASRGKAGDRAWSVVPILVSVILSGAFSAAVAYFITRPGK